VMAGLPANCYTLLYFYFYFTVEVQSSGPFTLQWYCIHKGYSKWVCEWRALPCFRPWTSQWVVKCLCWFGS